MSNMCIFLHMDVCMCVYMYKKDLVNSQFNLCTTPYWEFMKGFPGSCW